MNLVQELGRLEIVFAHCASKHGTPALVGGCIDLGSSHLSKDWMGSCYRLLKTENIGGQVLYSSMAVALLSRTQHVLLCCFTFVHYSQESNVSPNTYGVTLSRVLNESPRGSGLALLAANTVSYLQP